MERPPLCLPPYSYYARAAKKVIYQVDSDSDDELDFE